MINLLPQDRQLEIRAGRTNVLLSRYVTILVVAVTFLVGILYITIVTLTQTKVNSDGQETSNTAKLATFADTQAKLNALSSSIPQATAVLKDETRYSKLLTGLGDIMPVGAVVTQLDTTQTATAAKPQLTATIYATSADVVMAVQAVLKESSLLTSPSFKVADSAAAPAGYPAGTVVTAGINSKATTQ